MVIAAQLVACLVERLEIGFPLLDGTGRYCLPALLQSTAPRRWLSSSGGGACAADGAEGNMSYGVGRRFASRSALDCAAPSFWPRLLVRWQQSARCDAEGRHRSSAASFEVWSDGARFFSERHDAQARLELAHPRSTVGPGAGCSVSGGSVEAAGGAGGDGDGGVALSPALAALMRAGAGLGGGGGSAAAGGPSGSSVSGSGGSGGGGGVPRIDVAVRSSTARGASALLADLCEELDALRLECCPGAMLVPLALVMGDADAGTDVTGGGARVGAIIDGPLCCCSAVAMADLEKAEAEKYPTVTLGGGRYARVEVLLNNAPAFTTAPEDDGQ